MDRITLSDAQRVLLQRVLALSMASFAGYPVEETWVWFERRHSRTAQALARRELVKQRASGDGIQLALTPAGSQWLHENGRLY